MRTLIARGRAIIDLLCTMPGTASGSVGILAGRDDFTPLHPAAKTVTEKNNTTSVRFSDNAHIPPDGSRPNGRPYEIGQRARLFLFRGELVGERALYVRALGFESTQ